MHRPCGDVDFWNFGEYERADAAEQRVLVDVLCPEFTDPYPSFLLSQWLWRYRRWRRGAWKQKLVYPESMFRTFFVQLKSHLMKPAELGKM